MVKSIKSKKNSKPAKSASVDVTVVEAVEHQTLAPVGVKDVLLAFTMRGEPGLDELVLAERPHILRRAHEYCREQKNEAFAEKLASYASQRNIMLFPGRGNNQPAAGQQRSYKAQQVGEQEPFIRLPVSVLGVKKGQIVTVSFHDTSIDVRKD